MRRLVVCVRDRASNLFGQPFLVVARGQAIRTFTDEVNKAEPGNPLYAHPEDYDLYELGGFEDSTAIYDTGVPEMICVGKDVSLTYGQRR